MSDQQEGPLLVHVSAGGAALLWSAAEARDLRERHGIAGSPAGSLARQPRQNSRLGLPVILMAEEARLLAETGAAVLVRPSAAEEGDGEEMERRVQELEEERERGFREQRRLAIRERRARMRGGLAATIARGREAKRRKTRGGPGDGGEGGGETRGGDGMGGGGSGDGMGGGGGGGETRGGDGMCGGGDGMGGGGDGMGGGGGDGMGGGGGGGETRGGDGMGGGGGGETRGGDGMSGGGVTRGGDGMGGGGGGGRGDFEDAGEERPELTFEPAEDAGERDKVTAESGEQKLEDMELGEACVDHHDAGQEAEEDNATAAAAGDDKDDEDDDEDDDDDDAGLQFTRESMLVQVRTASATRTLRVVEWRAASSLWPHPALPHHELRYRVYRDLQRRGLHLTSGAKFGGDFLVYPGDPLRFHSHFIALCHDDERPMALVELLAAARLGSNVKKTVLLCSPMPRDGVRYTSLQWSGWK
ncbi:tRNA-splicing endonuclease subunit Sen34 [Lethenteron reissneri]|uniref:tRNA-splicing endonuclease subunit Sen34 n=1 Tax=Lethenteron reissneri TaxID=7753 RepID=UPI002AB73831|nr:tRNA-splicing endonuclease subunit Sen34 [Lethenteron reissneri]